jgi:N-acetylneuraminate lyase
LDGVVSAETADLRRIFSALVTPMRADESVDHDVLGALVERQLGRGVEGFYCCGSSGEALLLSLEERKQVVRTVTEAAAGRVPVIAHVGTIRTADAVGLARHAQETGVEAVSMIPPYYYAFSSEEINAYYETVVAACDLPMIVYNKPQFTRYSFDKSNAASLFDNRRIIGLKHTSQDLYALERLRAAYPDKVYFNGFDEMFLAGLAAGANAAVGTTVNVQPERFLQLRDCFDRGDVAGAQRLQRQINDVVEVLVTHGIFPAVKYLTTLQGLHAGTCRAPFRALDSSGRGRRGIAARAAAGLRLSVEDGVQAWGRKL